MRSVSKQGHPSLATSPRPGHSAHNCKSYVDQYINIKSNLQLFPPPLHPSSPDLSTLRTVLNRRSAHLEILWFPMSGGYLHRDIFAQFKTIQGKQNLANAFGIQKENWE